MSKLTAEDRRKLPASDFGDPERKLFPIVDASDVADAASLIGKAKNPDAVKARIKAIAKRKGFAIPKAWETADMSANPESMVIKRGKLFEAGSYDKQHFSISPEEMALAVENFTPVPVRDTHMARETSLLDGKLGQVQSIALDPADPYTLLGDVAIPQWLDDALAGTELSVSAEWDRSTKQLAGLALLTNPQIEDAVIFAAFAKATHNTPQGQGAMQMIHDDAARSGAVCNPPASFASKHEATATQQIHDITVDHGAKCASGAAGGMAYYSQQSEQGAPSATGTPVLFSRGKEKRMSFGERFKAWFTSGMVGDLPLADEAESTTTTLASIGITPETPAATAVASFAADPEKEAMKAEIAALKAARIQAEAVGFADSEIAGHRAYPAEREALIAAFSQASYDDGAGTAQFSAGKSRVQLLRDAATARPAHSLTTEQLKPEDVTALFNQMTTPQAGAPTPLSDERKAALLNLSPLGQAVQKNGTGRN